jgi:D-serine deaminase-like pyridoxal phosphate-dependent protein
LNSSGYTWLEVEQILASGDVKGRISRNDLPTPALLLDLDAFEANTQAMVQHVQRYKRALRPHGKTHKCPEIAKLLIRAGAVGACVAKISEAEVFSQNGVDGLLITCPVVGKHKIERALMLAEAQPDTMFCVDYAPNVCDLNDAAATARVHLNLVLDLRVGGRTGVRPGDPALDLAQLIDALPNVKLVGLQAYAGHAAHVIGWEQRRQTSRTAMGEAVETRWLLQSKGIDIPLLTGGSTGTYDIDSEIDGITELQPGSFIFMDLAYQRIGGKRGPEHHDFLNALTVLTTVISMPTKDRAIVDAGFKAFSTDEPFPPEAKDAHGIGYEWGGDEHGYVAISNSAAPLNVGDTIEFVIPHCDPSVNLYDRVFGLRGGNVEQVWSISARGKSQ